MGFQKVLKPGRGLVVSLLLISAAVVGAVIYSRFHLKDQPAPEAEAPPVRQITALGRLEPEAEVIKVTAPVNLSNDRVSRLLVQRDDRVKVGQVIAVLASSDRLQDTLLEAQQRVKVAQAQLAQIKAGAKSGEIAAQKAEISRLQAELQGELNAQAATIARWRSEVNNATADYQRYLILYRNGAVAASEFDQRRLALETAQAQFNEAQANQNRTASTLRKQIQQARATLDHIAEVRSVDVRVVQAQLEEALATVKRTKTELSQAYVRSPMAGRILEIYAKPGEAIGNNGAVDLGQTDRMQVVAEVYQSDINKVRSGQRAIVTGESFSGEIRGTVRLVGLQIKRQNIFTNQPGENLDRRIVEVRIRLDPEDSKRVANLTNLQVLVAIQP